MPYAALAGHVNVHEATHVLTAKALGIPSLSVEVDPVLGGGALNKLLHPLFLHSAATPQQLEAAASHLNQALVCGAPSVLGFASGAALMAYALRHRKRLGSNGKPLFIVGLMQTAMTGQYALGELAGVFKGQGDFSMAGSHLLAAAHKVMHTNPEVSFNPRLSAFVGVAAVAAASYATYKLPPLVARAVKRMREASLKRRLAAVRRAQAV